MSLNIADLFEAVADAIPERVPLILEGERHSYADVELRANQLAHHLLSAGVKPGGHVGVHMRNCIEYVETMIACLKIRAVPINVNFRYTGPELAYVYQNSRMTALAVEREFVESAVEVAAQCPDLRQIMVVGEGPDVDAAGELTVVDFEKALAAQPEARDFEPRSESDHFIIYTGGTTGMPKGVVWEHRDFFFAALSGANIGGAPRQNLEEVVEGAIANTNPPVRLMIPPLMHGAATYSVLTAFLSAGPIVLSRGFDPQGVPALVEREKITSITVVGDAIARPIADAIEADAGAHDVSSLTLIGSGGALFSQHVKDQLCRLLPGLRIIDAFGASESGNDGFVLIDPDGTKRIAGNPNMILVDENFRQIEPGTDAIGFIARRRHVPVAYFDDPVKTAQTFPVVDGVRLSVPGDRGQMTPDGTIILLGRGSTCINSGGEKIYPEEVEQALKSHPAVLDAVVAGLPDERYGERVAAVVQLRDGATGVEPGELAEHCRASVAGYKIPRSVVLVPNITRSPSGKADYRWARETLSAAEASERQPTAG